MREMTEPQKFVKVVAIYTQRWNKYKKCNCYFPGLIYLQQQTTMTTHVF